MSNANEPLAHDLRETNLKDSAWRYFDGNYQRVQRKQSRVGAFVLILIVVVVIVELARAI